MTRFPLLPVSVVLTFAVLSLGPRSASALQPVSDFLEHAKTWNPQNRAAHATTDQRDAEFDVQTGNLLPNFSAAGTYTRNQYEVTTGTLLPTTGLPKGLSIPNEVIQPQDQFDANVLLTVPLINIANWDRRAAARATRNATRADEDNTGLTVQKSVVRDYFTLLADEAVLISATKNVVVAEHNVTLAHDRKESGTGSELDVQRALADRAKAEQSVTAAQLAVTNTRREFTRSLYTLHALV